MTDFANYQPPKARTNRIEAVKFAAYYWLASATVLFAIGLLEETYGDGSFQRLLHSTTGLMVALTIGTAGTLLQFIFGWMTAHQYDERVGGRSSGRQQRKLWTMVSLVASIILGVGITMLA